MVGNPCLKLILGAFLMAPALAGAAGEATPRPGTDYVPEHLVVRLSGDRSSQDDKSLQQEAIKTLFEAFKTKEAAKSKAGTTNRFAELREGLYFFRLPTHVTVQRGVRIAMETPGVEWAEPNYILFPAQVGEATTPPVAPEAPDALPQVTSAGKSVVIAVIDTGTDYNHKDLAGNIDINYDDIAGDGIDNDGNGYVDDTYGYGYDRWYQVSDWLGFGDHSALPEGADDVHGTLVASVAAGKGSNNELTTPLSDNIKILPIRATTTLGWSAAVDYAIARGANVINLSQFTTWDSYLLSDALERARAAGVTVVTASGNDGRSINTKAAGGKYSLYYPPAWGMDNVISVGYVDAEGKLDPNSNYGPAVDLYARGTDVMGLAPGDSKTMESGSSLAAPLVAYNVALLKLQNPEWTPQQLKDYLKTNANQSDNLNPEGLDRAAVAGRVLNPDATLKPEYRELTLDQLIAARDGRASRGERATSLGVNKMLDAVKKSMDKQAKSPTSPKKK